MVYYIVTNGDSGDVMNEFNCFDDAIIYLIKNKDKGAFGINKVVECDDGLEDEYELCDLDDILKYDIKKN